VTHVHCPECGFQNPESSNYCSRCGALLIRDEPVGHTTMTFAPDELAHEEGGSLEDLRIEGTALVVRRADEGYLIEDAGSLNGTYVNRRRVEKARLEDGDEVQIGKYRLTFLGR
jgi:hypothetical protein